MPWSQRGHITSYYESAITSFRPCFARRATFAWFAVVMVGFIVRGEDFGISSFIRWLDICPACYESMLNFFRSSAWSVEGILSHWWMWLRTNAPFVEVNGRVVLVGDHTNVVKEARKMPGVATLHQNSETSSKPSFFRGHCWAFVAVLVSSASCVFATPLWGKLDSGLEKNEENTDRDSSMITRMVRMAVAAALRMGMPCYLVLDAFFAVGPTFLEAQEVYCVSLREQFVHIITRAKKNAVAYLDPETPPPGRRGRKPKYGKKLRLSDLFSDMADSFRSATCVVYGREETISYLCLDLLWKPVKHKIRFVLAVTARGSIVLMSSDLNLDPVEIVRLYSLRTRIETMFFVLKHIMGGMAYHFWCKCLRPQSRRPKKNSTVPVPHRLHQLQFRRTWKAIEGFVNFAAIAQGLIQIMALNFREQLWGANHVWLRTYSSQVPSEYVTKEIMARCFTTQLLNFKPSMIIEIIQSKQSRPRKHQQLRATG